MPMSEQVTRPDAGLPPPDADASPEEEEFKPVGSIFLLILYILVFASAWGLVYFNDLLARR